MLKLNKKEKEELEKKQYGIYEHTAVQICEWNKRAIRGTGVCYKQKFYNAHTHRCMQFTPLSLWCNNRCIFCWRPVEYMKKDSISEEDVLKPEEFVDELIEKRKKLLIGFKGRKGIDLAKFNESLEPDHFAISLSGEPTMYPYLDKLVILLRKKYKARTIFIVTNGQCPHMLKKLAKHHALPDQLYLSVSASNKDKMKLINNPLNKDYWERMLSSLNFLREVGDVNNNEINRGYVTNPKKTRTVIRYTVIKGLNDSYEELKEFAELFKIARPWFIEVKAYMYLGLSKQRLKKENMPFHKDIVKIAEKLNKMLEGYEIADEQQSSRIVVLKRSDISKENMLFQDR